MDKKDNFLETTSNDISEMFGNNPPEDFLNHFFDTGRPNTSPPQEATDDTIHLDPLESEEPFVNTSPMFLVDQYMNSNDQVFNSLDYSINYNNNNNNNNINNNNNTLFSNGGGFGSQNGGFQPKIRTAAPPQIDPQLLSQQRVVVSTPNANDNLGQIGSPLSDPYLPAELMRNVKVLKIADTGGNNSYPAESRNTQYSYESKDNFSQNGIPTNPPSSLPSTPQVGPPIFDSNIYPTFQPPILFQLPENIQMSNEKSAQLLEDMFLHLVQQKEQLNRINLEQRNLIKNPSQELFNQLSQSHTMVKNVLNDIALGLEQLFESVVLTPSEISKVITMRGENNALSRQLALLESELSQLTQPSNNPPCFAELVISKQPFPLILNGKGRQIPEESLEVHVLTGSNTSIQLKGPIVGHLVGEGTHNQGEMLDPSTAQSPVSLETRSAKFALKFINSTRRLPVNIRFSLQVVDQATNTPYTIESPLSKPLIVTTHDTQWDSACGSLIKKELFEDSHQNSANWAKFVNVLHFHFLKATKQEFDKPLRTLSEFDLGYIQRKYFKNKETVTPKDFDEFWGWFGKVLHRLRFQRHVSSLWAHGFVYGYMTKSQAEALLKNQEIGSSLVRFSESEPGQFAVSYVAVDRSPKHYLLDPQKDVSAARVTIADFLLHTPQFIYLMVFGLNEKREPCFSRVSKHDVLTNYCSEKSSKKTKTPNKGYEPLL